MVASPRLSCRPASSAAFSGMAGGVKKAAASMKKRQPTPLGWGMT
jgi:hypothetical protein